MKKSEKQMEAKRLFTKYIPFEFKTFEYINQYKRKSTGHVCIVNNMRFVRAGDLYLTETLRHFIEVGMMSRDDILPGKQVGEGHTFTGRPCTLLKLSTLKRLKKEFLDGKRWSNEDEMDNYINGAEEVESPPYSNFTPQKILEIWQVYDRRQQLIVEGTRERKEEKIREEMKEAGYTFDETDKPKDELADLVDSIEALGWHVTLTRKEGA